MPELDESRSAVVDRALERLYARRIDELESRVHTLETSLLSLSVKAETLSNAVRGHEARLGRLRIDKQIIGFPRWIGNRVTGKSGSGLALGPGESRSNRRLLILAPKYPSLESPYGGQPVERRVRYYLAHGFDVTIFVPEAREELREDANGALVVRGSPTLIPELVSETGVGQICIHHPVPELWNAVRGYVGTLAIHVWVHGYEARDWRSLGDNFTPEEMRADRFRLDALQVDRQRTLAEIFHDERVTKIFVSEFMQGVAEEFAGVRANNSHVIHNVVDTEQFEYRPKTPELRSRILAVRSFSARNYGTDMIRPVIELLAGSNGFADLHFEVRGDGRYFVDDTKGLARFSNVEVIRGIVSPAELRGRFAENGILLNPTRWDSQGMTVGEAMASGLVPVTNRVAAIPEFVSDETAMLAPSEDVAELAAGIRQLREDPDLFLEKSRNASERARAQCGPHATVAVEVELLEGAKTPV